MAWRESKRSPAKHSRNVKRSLGVEDYTSQGVGGVEVKPSGRVGVPPLPAAPKRKPRGK